MIAISTLFVFVVIEEVFCYGNSCYYKRIEHLTEKRELYKQQFHYIEWGGLTRLEDLTFPNKVQ